MSNFFFLEAVMNFLRACYFQRTNPYFIRLAFTYIYSLSSTCYVSKFTNLFHVIVQLGNIGLYWLCENILHCFL